MEGPPRVFTLIKMSVKSLPGNQDSADPPHSSLPYYPPTSGTSSTRSRDLIKKAGHCTVYVVVCTAVCSCVFMYTFHEIDKAVLLCYNHACLCAAWMSVFMFDIKCQPYEWLSVLFDMIFHFLRAPAADTLMIRSFCKAWI